MIGISLFSGRTLVSHFDFGIDNKSMFLIQSLAVLSLDYYVGANAPDRIPPAWIFSRVVRPAAFTKKLILS
jgi:hypothetical protein